MISIRKFLSADSNTSASMLRVAQLLLRGIGDHAIRCEDELYANFRESMERAAAALANSTDTAEPELQAGGAIRQLEEYNRRTAQNLRVRGSELQGMVKMLTTVVGEISTAGEENVSRLRGIEEQVSSATQVDDVRAVRAQLSVCLGEIRKEADRQKVAARGTVERLTQDLRKAQGGPATDSVTGLPVRAEAMELVSNACESKQPAFAAVMVIDRLQAVNTAFGPIAGDQLLRHFAGYVRRGLPPGDQLFRWTGASLLALISRRTALEPLRDEIGRLMKEKLEFTTHTTTRSVRLPVTARWALFPMMTSSQMLIQKIDGFAGIQCPRISAQTVAGAIN